SMDEGKVNAVHDWPIPCTIKELQLFLGFANFYRRFIHNFSLIVTPLASLLRGKLKSLSCSPLATKSFEDLKEAFTQAPVHIHPNPQLPFTVEVDTSTTGVGAVLLQHQSETHVLHPCAFFSCKFTPAEVNYDIGNRELLAIKLALEEWRHWLEGAQFSFTIFTDHKNLLYLRDAKRLNPHQACWALFFTRFNFTITYRPGEKNKKADALSRIHTLDEPEQPEIILPSSMIISPIQWSLEEENPAHPLPECPSNVRFIPQSQRMTLINQIHTSVGTGHNGISRTLSPHHLPTGKLHPLHPHCF
ncbi:MAG: Ty3/Gypsy family RNase HI domain-containing protein, partial [Cetobacterium sp.]